MARILNTHLVFYLRSDNTVLMLRDFRGDFNALTTRYFVFDKNQLRESSRSLDPFLKAPSYFEDSQCPGIEWRNSPESAIATFCNLEQPAFASGGNSPHRLSSNASNMFNLWNKKILVVLFKGIKSKTPCSKTRVTNLTTTKKSILEPVCVIAPPEDQLSMKRLDLKSFDHVLCFWSTNKLCELSPSFKNHLLTNFCHLPNDDVNRDKVETLEVGAGGANLFAKSKKKASSKETKRKQFACDRIKKYCQCETCNKNDEYNENMSKGGPEQLLTYRLSLADCLHSMGNLTEETKMVLEELSRLSVAAFDIESMTIKLDHNLSRYHMPYAEIDNVGFEQQNLAIQKPIMIAHRDGLLADDEPCKVFTLESDAEECVFSLVKSYWKYVVQRHELAQDKKYKVARPLFEFYNMYKGAYLEFAQKWIDPDTGHKLSESQIIHGWQAMLPGKIEGQLRDLIHSCNVFSFYGSGYDHILLQNYLVPYLFENKQGVKIEKRGNKVTSINVTKQKIVFRDVVKLLAPGTSLRSFGQLFKLHQEKAHFPFNILTGVAALSLPQLPSDLAAWTSDLSAGKSAITETEIAEAQQLFTQSNCKSVGDYLKTYLRLDVDILYKATQGWRKNMKELIDVDFVESKNFTISSVSNLAGQRCAAKNLYIGQFFPNNSQMYRILRKGMRG